MNRSVKSIFEKEIERFVNLLYNLSNETKITSNLILLILILIDQVLPNLFSPRDLFQK